jgi:hypothetical protein
MSEPNFQWRVNKKDMPQCCYEALVMEGYRRREASEPLLQNGDVFKCPTCGGEMICDPSLRDGRLRWRWNGKRN